MSRDVLILQTGGTIDKIYPRSPGAYGFEIGLPAIEQVLSRSRPSFQFRMETVCRKDSQDILDSDREDILRQVVEAREKLVLITHGTDTMCQTANYLVKHGAGRGFDCEPGVGDKVIVITGAIQPECMKESDADFNVGFSLGVLQSATGPGVFVCMGGEIIPGEFASRTPAGKFIDSRLL